MIGRRNLRRLALAGVMALAASVAVGQSAVEPQGEKLPAFDVVSVKANQSDTTLFRMQFTDDGVRIENASLLMIVRGAYGMFNSLDDKFEGIPAWAKSSRYDVEAKVSGADAAAFRKMDFDHRQQMVQAMLVERFRLRAHHETKEQAVYRLVIAKGGLKLKPAEHEIAGGTIHRGPEQITAEDIVIPQLVTALTQTVGRTVVDETGLTGKYDVGLSWAADGGDVSGEASIFTAIQEQLGLKLETGKGPVDVLVIDHIEQPSAN